MEPAELLNALSQPEAYPYVVAHVEVRQTHISLVFLAGPWVYKAKKPVQLGFLDFSTLERRHHFCQEEVRLNRRLAPSVYQGVVPVVRDGRGLRLEGEGEAVEWAVKMVRLPDDATLEQRLRCGEVGAEELRGLARRLAEFHAHAEAGEHIVAFGQWEVVARNARENFQQSEPLIGRTVHRDVFRRVQALTEAHLAELAPLIRRRAEQGHTRDTHGDLRLDHVYLTPDVVILDCIEFNERFRFADPVADMAFLVMDLQYHGYRALARLFTEAYLEAAVDQEGRQLVPFYTAYRAVVRGKVEGLKLLESEVPDLDKQALLRQARAHWLLALLELEEPNQRPCLLLVGGAPGTGKSTLARGLAERAGFEVLRSDVVRKELAGVRAVGRAAQDIYTPDWTERTYAECLARALDLLFQGCRVLVDATFREERRRQGFHQAAREAGVPSLYLECRAPAEVVRERLRQRRDDVSDADWEVYLNLVQSWEPASTETQQLTVIIDTGGDRDDAMASALDALRRAEIM
jgi:aminoglycoside phosphotransferase family enzyme/predicted kinase